MSGCVDHSSRCVGRDCSCQLILAEWGKDREGYDGSERRTAEGFDPMINR